MNHPPQKSSDAHRVIKASSKLQNKAGRGEIDKQSIERAEVFTKNNNVDYGAFVEPMLNELSEAIQTYKATPDHNAECADRIKNIIMDLKASAATFHFPLVSRLCTPVLLHLEGHNTLPSGTQKLLNLLHYLILLIVNSEGSAINDSLGNELEKAFLMACNAISKKEKKKQSS